MRKEIFIRRNFYVQTTSELNHPAHRIWAYHLPYVYHESYRCRKITIRDYLDREYRLVLMRKKIVVSATETTTNAAFFQLSAGILVDMKSASRIVFREELNVATEINWQRENICRGERSGLCWNWKEMLEKISFRLSWLHLRLVGIGKLSQKLSFLAENLTLEEVGICFSSDLLDAATLRWTKRIKRKSCLKRTPICALKMHGCCVDPRSNENAVFRKRIERRISLNRWRSS